MTIQEIDHLTEEFYRRICFNKEHYAELDTIEELFYGSGKLIDNNVDKPLEFTAQSFAQALMHQIESGNATYYAQQEIDDETQVFGTMAQRISVYEYSRSQDAGSDWLRGINYIQYIFTDGKWLITSMIWTDEKEGIAIPEMYLENSEQ